MQFRPELLLVFAAIASPLAGQRVDTARPPAEDTAQSVAVERPSYFYRGLPGSDQYVGPIDVLLNKAFNMSQATNRSRRIFGDIYGGEHLANSVLHPVRSIEQSGGWGSFFREQILPIQAVEWIRSGFDWQAADNMTWYPNYMGHFVEGGITSRRLAETRGSDRSIWIGATTSA